MVVIHIQIANAQAGSPLLEVNLYSVVVHLHHPEHVVRVDVNVEVMNLCGERKASRSNRNGVQIKSNKDERAPMGLTVDTNELALGKPHVGSVGQRRVRSGSCTSSSTLDMRQTHYTVEVRDLRRIADVR